MSSKSGIHAARHRNAKKVSSALLDMGKIVATEEEICEMCGGFQIYGNGCSGRTKSPAPCQCSREEAEEQATEIGMGSFPNIHMMHQNLLKKRG